MLTISEDSRRLLRGGRGAVGGPGAVLGALIGLMTTAGCSKPTARTDCPKAQPRAAATAHRGEAHRRATPAPRAPDARQTIPLSTLRIAKVNGDLGVPLGSIVTVEGDVLPDDHRRRKADLGKILLRVRSAGGKTRPQTTIMTLRGGQDVRRLKPGQPVRLLAYETGGFSGAPEGLFKHVPAFTTVGYSFQTWLSVIKILP